MKMATPNLSSCKVRVLWPKLKNRTRSGLNLESDNPSPRQRFQKPPVSDADLALLLNEQTAIYDSQVNESTIIKLIASDGSLKVSSNTLTAFSEHFARMSCSNMKETLTRTVELTNFSLSTLESMIAYMTTGALPSDIDGLRQLSELSGYILQGPMESHIANTLVRYVTPENAVYLADFAATQPTGILYSKILRYLASLCSEDWFYPNVLGPDGVCLAVLKDLLLLDELCVTSETEVLSIIDAWLRTHPGANFSDFADVVRTAWLPTAYRPPNSSKDLASGDTSPEPCGNRCCRPRQLYLQHVHFVVLETIRNRSDVLAPQPFLEHLALPRFSSRPIFSNFIHVLCSAEGRPQRSLARFEIPRPDDGGIIGTKTPYKLEYFGEFGISSMPVVFLMVPSGVARLQLSPEITCEFVPLINFIERPVTKLVDICSCRRGLLVYLQKCEVDLIILVSKETGDAQLALTLEPIIRPRFYLNDELLHVECHYSLNTIVVSLDNFSIINQFEAGLMVCDYEVLCEDLKEPDEQACHDSSEAPTEATKRYSCSCKAAQARAIKDASGFYSRCHTSKFYLRCDDDLRFHGKKAVSLLIPIKGTKKLILEGEGLNVVVGFIPHRLFTVSSVCESLPKH
ncbi:uncharacterized protein LOC111249364 [Varroa destructor]|uniref:BTB domain-containing protein n=1 Tax=Varroa destructor TaxID=109461 RepID=A0A7M7JY62_VARDE|nr:uncharacterized protein LOC111249364 [Varroa destructor]